MKKLSYLAIALMVLAIPLSGQAQEWHQLVEQMANGSVNWTTGIIQAKGIGAPPENLYGKPSARPMALRAAQMDAYRNLLEVTKGVRISSTTTVRDFVTQSDVIYSRVEGIVKGAQIVKQQYMADGTVEVTMQMSLTGGFAQLVLPQDIKMIEPIKPIPTPPTPSTPTPSTIPAPTTPTPSETPPPPEKPETPDVGMQNMSKVYTGLVVDARGLSAKPAMSPKIIDESGQEVYGSAYVSREFAVQQGMSGYAKDIKAAQQNDRVTNTPLTVKGIRTEGPGRADIVISNADAALLRGASENLSFLRKCRVMIVVD